MHEQMPVFEVTVGARSCAIALGSLRVERGEEDGEFHVKTGGQQVSVFPALGLPPDGGNFHWFDVRDLHDMDGLIPALPLPDGKTPEGAFAHVRHRNSGSE